MHCEHQANVLINHWMWQSREPRRKCGEAENNGEPLDMPPTEPSGIDFSAVHPGDSVEP